MAAYYNEIDPFCCQWLRNLIAAGHITAGEVDERSIGSVQPAELREFQQWHFFAGIGGWPLALRLAGAETAEGIITGSPPCQDVSIAAAMHGRRVGMGGERTSLANHWMALIGVLRPSLVLFENVPGIKPWMSHITGGLEGAGYVIHQSERSSEDLGAPHRRRRVWAAAHRRGERLSITRRSESPAPFEDPRATAPGDYWIENPRGFRPMDDGLPERMAAVHAFGNAVDPQVAAEFIRAMMECEP